MGTFYFFKCSVFDFDLYSVTSFPTNSYLINFSKKRSSKNLQFFSRKKNEKKKKKSQKKFCINPLFPFNHQLLMFEIWPRNVFPSFLVFLKKKRNFHFFPTTLVLTFCYNCDNKDMND